MDSRKIDNEYPFRGDKDDKNEDKDNENNEFVDNTVINMDDNVIGDDMNYNNVNKNLTSTARDIVTGYCVFG